MKLALALLAAAVVLITGVGLTALWWVSRSLGPSPEWHEVAKAPPQFHLKAGAGLMRETGFTDPRYELFFVAPDAKRFRAENGLDPGARELDLGEGVSGQLWESGTAAVVYVVAFGT